MLPSSESIQNGIARVKATDAQNVCLEWLEYRNDRECLYVLTLSLLFPVATALCFILLLTPFCFLFLL
jgi:hypothetical protein